MKLIVGLGNPGEQYENTRHNMGFLFLDYLRGKKDFSEFKFESKFNGETADGIFKGEKTILLKPQTFMNLSGESVKKITNFYKINLEDTIIIYDDISMDFGKIRIRNKGSAGGHNGVKNIIRLFNDEFNRIKIGIGFNDNYNVSDWVLSKFTPEELIDLENIIFPRLYELVKTKEKV